MIQMTSSRRSRRDKRHWDDQTRHPAALGCSRCVDLEVCGGLHRSAGAFDCLTYCCGRPDDCSDVCQRNPAFVERVREVSGFYLTNVSAAKSVSFPTLP